MRVGNRALTRPGRAHYKKLQLILLIFGTSDSTHVSCLCTTTCTDSPSPTHRSPRSVQLESDKLVSPRSLLYSPPPPFPRADRRPPTDHRHATR